MLVLLRKCSQRSFAAITWVNQEWQQGAGTLRSLSRAARSTSGAVKEKLLLGEDEFVFESGALAQLADGSAAAQHGGTVVLTTVVSSRELDTARDFLPLQVDYREPLAAAGRVPKDLRARREPTNTERETLCARAIDRAVRPLFAPHFFYDTHIHSTVLAADGVRDPEVLAINAASAALMCSDIPWGGPVGAVQVAYVGGNILLHPTRQQMKEAALKLTLAGTANWTVMIEAAGNQVPEDVVAAAIRMGQVEVVKLVEAQQKLAKHKGKPKRKVELVAPTPQHVKVVKELVHQQLLTLFQTPGLGKAALGSALQGIQEHLLEELRKQNKLPDSQTVSEPSATSASDPPTMTHTQALMAYGEVQKSLVRALALDKAARVGGRKMTELRPISCAGGVLPSCVHGSAVFQRGETQSLCSATVASERDCAEGLTVLGPVKRHFVLHYNFPPASVNEVGKLGQPSRREIGHGALAEKALAPLMPSQEDFPFFVRVIADTLMSNGSSSMAAVCAGSLALKDAGVPISSLAAGISIGLITEKGPDLHVASINPAAAGHSYRWPKDYGRHALLTDIQGIEDHLGEMDFKVAGTRVGITAIQLDVKLPGVPHEWLIDALQPAKAARQHLLTLMEDAADQAQPANEMERPMLGSTSINKELLTRLIGLDGENLLRLEEESGAKVVVDESGVVEMYAPTQWQFHKAEALVKEVEGASIKEGQLYNVKVVSVHDFGAMVELPNGVQSLLHINELSHFKIRDIQDVVTVGTELVVKCIGRDEKGLIKLSRKAAMPKSVPGPEAAAPSSSTGSPQDISHQQALAAAQAFAAKITKPNHTSSAAVTSHASHSSHPQGQRAPPGRHGESSAPHGTRASTQGSTHASTQGSTNGSTLAGTQAGTRASTKSSASLPHTTLTGSPPLDTGTSKKPRNMTEGTPRQEIAQSSVSTPGAADVGSSPVHQPGESSFPRNVENTTSSSRPPWKKKARHDSNASHQNESGTVALPGRQATHRAVQHVQQPLGNAGNLDSDGQGSTSGSKAPLHHIDLPDLSEWEHVEDQDAHRKTEPSGHSGQKSEGSTSSNSSTSFESGDALGEYMREYRAGQSMDIDMKGGTEESGESRGATARDADGVRGKRRGKAARRGAQDGRGSASSDE